MFEVGDKVRVIPFDRLPAIDDDMISCGSYSIKNSRYFGIHKSVIDDLAGQALTVVSIGHWYTHKTYKLQDSDGRIIVWVFIDEMLRPAKINDR